MEENIRSLENKLNNVIDDELKKDTNDIDTNLITECCDGLLRMDDISKYLITEKEAKKNIRQILNHGKEKRKLKKPVKVLLVAAIIAVLLAIAALGYAQVKYDILHFSDHSDVSFTFNSKKQIEPLVVGYIPVGFEKIDEYNFKRDVGKDYSNGELHFTVSKDINSGDVSINTEYGEAKTCTIDGIDYMTFGEAEHGAGVLWVANGYRYQVVGVLSVDELLKIALSVS